MSDKSKNNGSVFLVGAGPGDPGLITVKGATILKNCDVVIYDNLIPAELIVTLPCHTEKIYAGKKAGKHTLPQNDINRLMVKLARAGKKVVRLKGSDPLIFGRGGEEARYLKEHDIKFEIVPGVTSGIAAPAYCGIPCTDRNLASFVLFVTGHKAMDKEFSSVPWDWVAKAKNGTIVIYMGVGEIENIVNTLIQKGLDPSTPAAAIERGTYPTQKYISSPLSDIAARIKDGGIKPPALFLIGQVISMRRWLEWFEGKPLMGKRVMVTRAARQSAELYGKLRELGVEVLPYPTIEILEQIDSTGWDRFRNDKDKIGWLIFTSRNGVKYFFRQYRKEIGDLRGLSGYNIATIGDGTSAELNKYGILPDFAPRTATVNDFGKELVSAYDLHGATIVRIRGTMSGDNPEKYFSEIGATIIPLTVYETIYPEWPDDLKENLFESPPDAVIFTSSSTVTGLTKNLSSDEINKLMGHAAAFSIGPSTSRTLEKYGIKVTAEAKPHNLKALITLLENFYQPDKMGG